MVAKVMAVVVALFLLGGVAQSTSFHATSTCTVELASVLDLGDVLAPVEPVQTIAPIRHPITIVMPSIDPPIASVVSSRTFRPPRG